MLHEVASKTNVNIKQILQTVKKLIVPSPEASVQDPDYSPPIPSPLSWLMYNTAHTSNQKTRVTMKKNLSEQDLNHWESYQEKALL